jgi:hypothetical protein
MVRLITFFFNSTMKMENYIDSSQSAQSDISLNQGLPGLTLPVITSPAISD